MCLITLDILKSNKNSTLIFFRSAGPAIDPDMALDSLIVGLSVESSAKGHHFHLTLIITHKCLISACL